MRALSALDLDSDADFRTIKAAYRRLPRNTTRTSSRGDEEAATRFQQVQAAYDVLRKAEERRLALGSSD
jgi:DnaJ-class molecular chaperone